MNLAQALCILIGCFLVFLGSLGNFPKTLLAAGYFISNMIIFFWMK